MAERTLAVFDVSSKAVLESTPTANITADITMTVTAITEFAALEGTLLKIAFHRRCRSTGRRWIMPLADNSVQTRGNEAKRMDLTVNSGEPEQSMIRPGFDPMTLSALD